MRYRIVIGEARREGELPACEYVIVNGRQLDAVEEMIRVHPEIGLVLAPQCGAQSEGCAFDTADRSEDAAPAWLREILAKNRALWAQGQPGSIDAVLASDGWWWRVL